MTEHSTRAERSAPIERRQLLGRGVRVAAGMIVAGLPTGRAFGQAPAARPTPGPATPLAIVLEELVAAGRILSTEGVIDAFGHVSCRHPLRPRNFLMSRARPPVLATLDDIMEFDGSGAPVDARGRKPYLERFIHAAVYEARPDVRAVMHGHSPKVVPFSVSKVRLRPLGHTGGVIGAEVPVWDIAERFGSATNLLVANMEMGRDLARRLGSGSTLLMRGHGAVVAAQSIRLTTFTAVTLDVQAQLTRDALALGEATPLSPQEVAATAANFAPTAPVDSVGRAWEYWCARAGVPFRAQGAQSF